MLPSDSHYELLEVPPTASFEDIRRANRRIRDVYGAESIAVCGLYDPASLEAVHRRLDLAYTTLMDAAKRKDYDLDLFPDGVPMPVSRAPSTEHVPPPRPAAKGEDPATLTVRPPMPELTAAHRVLGPAAAPDPRGGRRRAARDRRALEDRHGVPAGARGRGLDQAAGAGVRARLPRGVRARARPRLRAGEADLPRTLSRRARATSPTTDDEAAKP